ncbi:MAG TPA: PAN domain-containing protein [Thermoanaerobaculia bacterium]|jgi:hypothetical protein
MKRLMTLLVLLLAVPMYAQVKTEQGTETLWNVNRLGSDIAHFEWDAPPAGEFDLRQSQCAAACWTNNSCLSWTYVKPGYQGPKGNCWLKNSVPAASANACCISGTVAEVGTDRPGGDYRRFENVAGAPVTPRVCQASCFHDAECNSWTWVKPGVQGALAHCYLKHTVQPPARNACCVSGYFATEVIR